jgi:hypothetical protein
MTPSPNWSALIGTTGVATSYVIEFDRFGACGSEPHGSLDPYSTIVIIIANAGTIAYTVRGDGLSVMRVGDDRQTIFASPGSYEVEFRDTSQEEAATISRIVTLSCGQRLELACFGSGSDMEILSRNPKTDMMPQTSVKDRNADE